jgi:hypothetical protein
MPRPKRVVGDRPLPNRSRGHGKKSSTQSTGAYIIVNGKRVRVYNYKPGRGNKKSGRMT